MKKSLTAMIMAIMVLRSAAQSKVSHVSPEVKKAFSLQYPAGHLKKWGQKNGEYVAAFRQQGKKYLAYYTPGGNWKATTSPVKWTRNLPADVRAGWNTCKYMDWLIMDMNKIDQPGETQYSIHVGQVQSLGPDDADIGSEYILFFSDKGELIRKERIS